MIRVLVADDHAVVREGVKRIIADTTDMVVAGEATTAAELEANVVTGQFDVVLMDLAMPGLSGLEALRDLHRRRPRLPLLVLSIYPEEPYAVRALVAGAAGYINKGSPPDEIINAIRTVAAGHRYITAPVAQGLASYVNSAASKPPHTLLSNREYQVLCLLASGQSVSEVARQLALSVKTISTFRARVLRKLGLQRNADLVRYALQHGLIESP
jgi:two-component system invasion response regulator UvrY